MPPDVAGRIPCLFDDFKKKQIAGAKRMRIVGERIYHRVYKHLVTEPEAILNKHDTEHCISISYDVKRVN